MKNPTFRLLRTYAEARSGAATCNTNFPRVWPATAYQSGVIELSDLKERRERVSEECKRLEEKLIALKQQQQEQQRQAALATTIEEFCRNINSALDKPEL